MHSIALSLHSIYNNDLLTDAMGLLGKIILWTRLNTVSTDKKIVRLKKIGATLVGRMSRSVYKLNHTRTNFSQCRIRSRPFC